MYPLFNCEYCSFSGREGVVKLHEPNCKCNPANRTCFTCTYAEMEVPEGAIHCKKLDKTFGNNLDNVFASFFTTTPSEAEYAEHCADWEVRKRGE